MDESKVIMKGRLGPGMMITVDLTSGQVCSEVLLCFATFFSCCNKANQFEKNICTLVTAQQVCF